MADGATSRASHANRGAIGITRAPHKGPRGFTNLLVEKQGGEIVLNMHVTSACVMIFDEDAARVLSNLLGQWLG